MWAIADALEGIKDLLSLMLKIHAEQGSSCELSRQPINAPRGLAPAPNSSENRFELSPMIRIGTFFLNDAAGDEATSQYAAYDKHVPLGCFAG